MYKCVLCLAVIGFLPVVQAGAQADPYVRQREEMVQRQLRGRDITDPLVLEAMRTVPRHEFVRPQERDQAYRDSPLPIGYGQTISQPYIVALMTQLISPRPGMRALEIGTGSGYQAAVLAEILDEVYTIEIVEPLADWGASNLRRSGYERVQVRQADGYYGWPEHAPFDVIVVTAAAGSIPPPLIEQLADDGVMVIPVGSPFRTQMLTLVRREGNDITTEAVLPVRFVPFVRASD
jgi:protein-L-isoaspartate(D-aspartate) O-methyltransferase